MMAASLSEVLHLVWVQWPIPSSSSSYSLGEDYQYQWATSQIVTYLLSKSFPYSSIRQGMPA